MEIREARMEDAALLIAYLKQLGSETDNLTFGSEDITLTVEDEQNFLLSASSDGLDLYAFDGGKVIGSVQLIKGHRPRTEHSAEFAISVIKAYWGKGVSTSLFEKALEWVKKQQVTKINLLVRSDNLRAKAFYAKCGFKKEGIDTRMFCMKGKYIDGEYWGLEL